MEADMVERWRVLLRSCKVEGTDSSFNTRQDVDLLEGEMGIKLPNAYKEFCEVFGSGLFGGFIAIFCPNSVGSMVDVRNQAGTLGALREQMILEENQGGVAWDDETVTKDKAKLVLANAFVFGSNPNAHAFLWDLQSYRESEDSCDIYLVPTDDVHSMRLVGTDFYEFIKDFCLGAKANEVLPDNLNFHSELTGNIFFRFPQDLSSLGTSSLGDL